MTAKEQVSNCCKAEVRKIKDSYMKADICSKCDNECTLIQPSVCETKKFCGHCLDTGKMLGTQIPCVYCTPKPKVTPPLKVEKDDTGWDDKKKFEHNIEVELVGLIGCGKRCTSPMICANWNRQDLYCNKLEEAKQLIMNWHLSQVEKLKEDLVAEIREMEWIDDYENEDNYSGGLTVIFYRKKH